ncbi:hypothetical protein HY768_08800 [candidate division TA06 bacterium]|uniref:Uncharacterized protein n=1 Tax=candidate division TA06 bacterium TaxID=2250710 RepID=A0A933I9Y6_UNCT6|nr:hypothetical protein [candidate division TA06 bacterium]
MDGNVLQKALERAFSDQQFRARLEANLDEALSDEGYELSSDERLRLKGILDEGKETFATGLDQRLSQSGVSLSPQALLRQKSKTVDQGGGLLRQTEALGIRKQPSRQAQAAEDAVPGKRQTGNSQWENIDDREPDYEVETD